MPDFSCRLLRKNHQAGLPKRILILDTEADIESMPDGEERHTVKLAWSSYGYRTAPDKWHDKYRFHECGLSLCKYIEGLSRQNEPLWVFAHNIGYDLRSMGFYKYFTKRGWVRVFNYEQGDVYILIIRKKKATIKLVSTTNYFSGTLKAIGETIGIKKGEIDFRLTSYKELSEYCRNDVVILKTYLAQYFDYIANNDLGQFRLTRGSQSFSAYRHRFMKKKIYLHRVPEVIDLERASYMGGRVECFRLGRLTETPYICLDINSMYPYLMSTLKLPCKLIDYQTNYSPDLLSIDLQEFSAVAEVELVTDFPYYAYRHNNKIIFPVGEFTAFLCSQGLKKALSLNQVKRINQVSIYKQADLFSEFVSFFYKQRVNYIKNNDSIRDVFCKKLLQSLYGKFGQKQPIQNEFDVIDGRIYERIANIDLVTGERDIEYIIMNKRIVQTGWTEGKDSFCAIAAHITEAGRILLADIIKDIGLNKVVYCDTDSVIIPESALRYVNYPMGQFGLGRLKQEKIYQSLELIGSKAYLTDQGRTIKGIPKRAIEVSKNRFEFIRFEGEKTHMREKIIDYQVLRPAFRQLTSTYDKGIVNADGTISPFSLPQSFFPS